MAQFSATWSVLSSGELIIRACRCFRIETATLRRSEAAPDHARPCTQAHRQTWRRALRRARRRTVVGRIMMLLIRPPANRGCGLSPTNSRQSRPRNADGLAVTITPPVADPAMVCSISLASRASIGVNSTPSAGATAWIAPNWPVPEVIEGSRMTAARVTPGAHCSTSTSSGYLGIVGGRLFQHGWPGIFPLTSVRLRLS